MSTQGFPFYDYQREDIERVYLALTETLYQGITTTVPLRAYLNYSEMGTGKTAVSWGVLDKLLAGGYLEGPVLVVGPSQCLHVWTKNALYADAFLRRFRVDKTVDTTKSDKHPVSVISYAALRAAHRREEDPLFDTEFSIVIFDEVHALKNSASKTSIAAAALTRKYSLGLSGTPIMNGGEELFSIMRNALRLDQVDYRHIKLYPKSNYAVTLLRSFSHGRKKSDIETVTTAAITCSDTQEGIEWTDMETKAVYVETKRVALGQFSATVATTNILACILRLRGCCLFPAPNSVVWKPNKERVDPLIYTILLCIRRQHPEMYANAGCRMALIGAVVPVIRSSDKMRKCMDIIKETAGKVVVVSAFRQFLEHHMTPYCRQNGVDTRLFAGGSKRLQQEALREFQTTASVKVLLLVKQAGAMGLNLQHSASTCIIMDPHYNRALDDQAAQRVNRIGQANNVRIVRLFMRGSIEELMLRMQVEKSKEVGAWFSRDTDNVAMFKRCGLFLRERDTVSI